MLPSTGLEITAVGLVTSFTGSSFDDHMLASCDVSIVSLKSLKGFDDPWMPNVDMIMLEGEEDEVTAHQVFKQAIPMDIMSGEYSLTFKVVDEAGNYTDYPVNITIE